MSKTFRKIPRSYYRRPKRNNARRDDEWIRHKAIPPNAWDDIPFNKEVYTPYTIAERMIEKGKSLEDVAKIMANNSKESYERCLEIALQVFEWNEYRKRYRNYRKQAKSNKEQNEVSKQNSKQNKHRFFYNKNYVKYNLIIVNFDNRNIKVRSRR